MRLIPGVCMYLVVMKLVHNTHPFPFAAPLKKVPPPIREFSVCEYTEQNNLILVKILPHLHDFVGWKIRRTYQFDLALKSCKTYHLWVLAFSARWLCVVRASLPLWSTLLKYLGNAHITAGMQGHPFDFMHYCLGGTMVHSTQTPSNTYILQAVDLSAKNIYP